MTLKDKFKHTGVTRKIGRWTAHERVVNNMLIADSWFIPLGERALSYANVAFGGPEIMLLGKEGCIWDDPIRVEGLNDPEVLRVLEEEDQK